jgi:hypothetical protein
MSPSFSFLARARSAKIDGCDGISHCLQVHTYSGEPLLPCNLACNLLAKDDCRAALLNKVAEHGPEVSLVVGACLLARAGERLAGQAGCPEVGVATVAGCDERKGVTDKPKTLPISNVKGERPACDAAEEVCLVMVLDVMGL